MQCGSNLFAIFLAFDCGGGLVSVPRSGMGTSGGEGGASGLSRDELSCEGGDEGLCASADIPRKKNNRPNATIRDIVLARLYCAWLPQRPRYAPADSQMILFLLTTGFWLLFHFGNTWLLSSYRSDDFP